MNRPDARHASPPLHDYVVLETTNFEKATWLLNQTPTPHSFDLIGNTPFYTRVRHTELPNSSITLTTTRGRLHVRVGPGSTSYIFWFTQEGACRRRVFRSNAFANPDQVVMQSPEDVTDILIGGHLEDVGVTIDQVALHQELENQLGRKVTKRVKFEPYLNPRAMPTILLRRRVMEICRRFDGGPLFRARACLASLDLERSVISLLVSSLRHNYTRLLNRECSAGPAQVRLAEDFIAANAELPMTIGDLAQLTGVSARTLEYGFKKHRGQSPMLFLRRVRFERARAELQKLATDTVSSVATRWGFLHLGRFAAEYKARFGESPSTTLRHAHR